MLECLRPDLDFEAPSSSQSELLQGQIGLPGVVDKTVPLRNTEDGKGT